MQWGMLSLSSGKSSSSVTRSFSSKRATMSGDMLARTPALMRTRPRQNSGVICNATSNEKVSTSENRALRTSVLVETKRKPAEGPAANEECAGHVGGCVKRVRNIAIPACDSEVELKVVLKEREEALSLIHI